MRRRQNLWKELAEISRELVSEMREYAAARTPQNRTRVETRVFEFGGRLAPVIGGTAAYQFHAIWQTYMDAMDREMGLLAWLADHPGIDGTEAEGELLPQFQAGTQAALGAFEAIQATADARIAQAASTEDAMAASRNDRTRNARGRTKP